MIFRQCNHGEGEHSMKTADFRGEIAPNGQIPVPPEIASQLAPGEKIEVVLRWDLSGEETGWRAAGRRRFEAAYTADDAVYEKLVDDASDR
jgi:hypothetical protein